MCHCEGAELRPWQSVLFFVANPVSVTFLGDADCHASGAPRSESKICMIAGGNHTLIKCELARNDILWG